jgi:hypothetical protein
MNIGIEEKINSNLEKILDELKKRNSFKYRFFLSLVKGVGYFIGFSILAGILLAVLVNFIQKLDIPFIDRATEEVQEQL